MSATSLRADRPGEPPPSVLFDLDGCIVDSLASIVRCWEETLPQFGLAVPSVEVIRAHVGPPLAEAAEAFAPNAEAQTVAALVGAYRVRSAQATDVEAYVGMPELLRSLHSGGWVLGIATSKSLEVVEPLLARLNLAPLFAIVEGTRVQELGTDKTTVVKRALAGLAPLTPGALIGDRRHDVVGAHAHGLKAIGVLWGYGSEAELTGAGADALVTNPLELAELLMGDATHE